MHVCEATHDKDGSERPADQCCQPLRSKKS